MASSTISDINSRSLDNRCALNNDQRIIREYFGIPKEATVEFKDQDQAREYPRRGKERVSSWVDTTSSEDK
jgi:hypothetical protein